MSGLPEEVDLVVAGSGAAGLAAALVASARGLKVVLVEKSDKLGGTTAYSAGTAWIPATGHLPDAQRERDRISAERYLEALCATSTGQDKRDAFLRHGRDAVAFLEKHADIGLFAPPFAPDYVDHADAATGGRALVTREFDGAALGKDLHAVRETRPGFTVLGGMMVNRADIDALLAPLSSLANLKHVLRILLRHALSSVRYRRSSRLVMGGALVGRLVAALRAHDVAILTGTALASIETDPVSGRVSAAILRSGGDLEKRVSVRRGVVLATGGFGASEAWRAELLKAPDAGFNVGTPSAGGDGLTLARAVGGAVENAEHGTGAFWMPTSILRESGKEPVFFPHIVLDRAKPGLIAVDADGRRFVNEANSYHDFCLGMFDRGLGEADKPAWLVFDRSFLSRYGVGLIHPGGSGLDRFRKAGYLVEAGTVDELAGRIGVPAAGLRETIARFNGFAASGRDLDFGKGETPLNRQNGDSAVGPNPCLGAIESAPYGAVAVWPATLATAAGIRTDANGRVLRADDTAVDGLYAVGNDMASIMQATYPGPGTTIGPAMVFAYLAARHASGNQPAPSIE